ncbi:hypothetical protein BV25DRAFT_962925 [Artomyces pyxidatus]|uniref:Uncharacterized protein n=1 Tax=Artomyces pyxidatus TaxID=48021 RepID=A0ACB8SW77_9AGAM|nr:hypothetical protein BV25DRAFT_962925 [Artomyces pyxidatus]
MQLHLAIYTRPGAPGQHADMAWQRLCIFMLYSRARTTPQSALYLGPGCHPSDMASLNLIALSLLILCITQLPVVRLLYTSNGTILI